MSGRFSAEDWGVILGGSSGFGLATAQKLAAHGMNLCVVHRDRRGSMTRIEPEFEKLRATRREADHRERRRARRGSARQILGAARGADGRAGRVRMLLHSIAFGNLKLIVPESARSRTRAPPRRARRRSSGSRSEALARRPTSSSPQGVDELTRGSRARRRIRPTRCSTPRTSRARSTAWARACSTGCRTCQRAAFRRRRARVRPDQRRQRSGVEGLRGGLGREGRARGAGALDRARVRAARRALQRAPARRDRDARAGRDPGQRALKAHARLRNPFAPAHHARATSRTSSTCCRSTRRPGSTAR